jgi:hypothetical protein
MPASYYWLASDDVSDGSLTDRDGVMLPFVEYDGAYRFCIMMRTIDNTGADRNSLMQEFLKNNLRLTAKDPPHDAVYQNFLTTSLLRKAPGAGETWETWTLFVFDKDHSPLTEFASTEISDAAGAMVLRIEPVSGNPAPWLQRPHRLTPGPGADDLSSHFRTEFGFLGQVSCWSPQSGFQFRLENNGSTFVVDLRLAFNLTFGNAENWFGFHALGSVGQTTWESGGKALVDASSTSIRVHFHPDDANTFTIPWHPGNTQLTLTGHNLQIVLDVLNAPPLRLDVLDGGVFQWKADVAFITDLFPTQSPEFPDPFPVRMANDQLVFPTRYVPPQTPTSQLYSPISIAASANLAGAATLLGLDTAPPTYLIPPNTMTFASAIRNADPHRLTTSDVNLAALGVSEAGVLQMVQSAAPLEAPTDRMVTCPVDLTFEVGGDKLTLRVAVRFDWRAMTLDHGPFNFKVIENPLPLHRHRAQRGTSHGMVAKSAAHLIDRTANLNFGLFALQIPAYTPDQVPTDHWDDAGRHGYFDIQAGEIVFDQKPFGEYAFWLPGGSDPQREKGNFPLILKEFDPLHPLDDKSSNPKIHLRINSVGVSLKGTLETGEAVTLQKDGDRFENLMAEPLPKGEDGTLSEIVILDSKILRGKVFANAIVPGTKDLRAEVMLRISQQATAAPGPLLPAAPPLEAAQFDASLRIAGDADEPTADLCIGFFRAIVSNPRLGLSWNHGGSKDNWDVTALVDAALTVAPTITLQNGMSELRSQDAIVLKDLDLTQLSFKRRQGSAKVGLRIHKFDFSIFGLVDIRLDDVQLDWIPGIVTFESAHAGVTFRSGDGVVGGIGVGGLVLKCEVSKIHVDSISGASVKLSVPGQFDFEGDVSWKDDDESSYFEIDGGLTTFGGFKVDGFLQFGSDRKANGERVRSIAAFASDENLNKMLLPWLWLQQGGIGAGYNRQLSNLSRNPTDDEILAKIDSLEPKDPNNWTFVADEGRYANVVGRLVFTSQAAAVDSVCGFVLWTIASIDTTGRILGAGKTWLFSSQKFADSHAGAPSIVAAMNIDLRKPMLTATAMTKKGGAIEDFPQLQEILDRTDTLLTLRIMPNLFDVYLQKLQYKQEWLKGTFDFEASWRFSLFEETMLQYVRAKVRGDLGDRLPKSPGGFEFQVSVDAGIDFGGVLGREGVMTWGSLQMGVDASCSAWIQVDLSVPYVKWKGLKSCVEWRTVTESKQMPRQSVQLGLSGSYAIQATGGGAAGARVAVHFCRNICGHELSISPEIVVRGDVLDDVQSKVRRFEAQIDQVARTSTEPFDPAGLNAFLSQRNRPVPVVAEEWLLVLEQDGSEKRWVVLPTFTAQWLTPTFVRTDVGLRFEFRDRVRKIEWSNASASGTITPAWDQANWPPDVPDPASATGEAQNLYRLNALFVESAIDSSNAEEIERDSTRRLARSESRLASLPIIVDHRPFFRLRDALLDEDRASLPADVYPFTYRPLSDPPYEQACAQLDLGRNGKAFLEDAATKWKSARAAILGLALEELRANGRGLFYLDDPSYFTPFVQQGDGPTTVKIQRDGGLMTQVKLVDLDSLYDGFASQIKTYPLCQEFRAASSDGATPAQVVMKFPVDFQGLFQSIGGGRATTWFDLVDYLQIVRGGSEVVADRLPIPAQQYVEQGESRVLLQPFVFTDVFSVDDKDRGSTARYLPAPKYELCVVPLGATGLLADRSFRSKMTIQFPSTDLYVPALDDFPKDLGLNFTIPPVLHSTAPEDVRNQMTCYVEIELIHVTSGANAADFPSLDADTHHFELWYQPRTLSHTGFYGRTLELRGDEDFRATPDKSGRYSRLANEASGQNLVSTVGLIRVKEPWLVPVNAKEGKFKLRIVDPTGTGVQEGLQLDEGHLFYVRPAGAVSTTPARELPVFARRDESFDRVSKPEPPQSVVQMELPVDASVGVGPLDFDFSPREANAIDRRHRILIDWTHPPDAQVGGVEIVVRDYHEKRIVLSRRVEVMTEDVFRRSERDFGVAHDWVIAESDGTPTMISSQSASTVPDAVKYYWDENRWFPNGSKLDVERSLADLAADGIFNDAVAPTFSKFVQVARDFWTQVARFDADPQSTDSNDERTVIHDVRCGLLAVGAGLFPSATGQTFKQLDSDYSAIKLSIDQTALDSVMGASEDEQFARRLDVLAARRLLALVEYRRSFMTWAVDGFGDQQPPAMTMVDQLRHASSGSGFDAFAVRNCLKDWKRSAGNQLPEADVEREVFRDWLEIPTPNLTADQLDRLGKLYPLSMWFFVRLVANRPDVMTWDDWRPGMRPGGVSQVDLHDFKTQIGTRPVDKYPVRFIVPLQQCLCLTPTKSGASPSWDDNPFEIRPHHALRIQRGQGDDPFIKIAVQDDLETFLPFGSASILPQFLNLLERLGLAVDVAYIDPKLGLLNQRQLVVKLEKRLQHLGIADFQFLVCRGRAAGDAMTTPEMEFSFVKLVALPNDRPPAPNRDWFAQFVAIQNLKWPDDPASQQGYTAQFFSGLDSLVKLAVTLPGANIPSIFLEHQGSAWSTVPSLGGRCHIALALPELQGQAVGVVMRALSRYELVADWLHWPKDSTEFSSSGPIRFRPFYLPPDPKNISPSLSPPPRPFALACPDRFVFTLPPLPDQADSRDNLLTMVRTGYRHCGIRFLERPVEQTILAGALSQLVQDPLFPQTAAPSKKIDFDPTLDVPVFPNETAIVVRNAPYYMESAIQIVSHYQLCPGSDSPSLTSAQSAFLRRKPSRIANRSAFAVITGDQITLTIPLVQHRDCLSLDEDRDRPNDQEVPIASGSGGRSVIAVRECPDLAFSYLLLFSPPPPTPWSKHAKGHGGRSHRHANPATHADHAALPRLLTPLLTIDLPLAPGFPSGKPPTAWARCIGSIVDPLVDEAKPIFVHDDGGTEWWFGVEVTFHVRPLSNSPVDLSELFVIATRDGVSTDPFGVKPIPSPFATLDFVCDLEVTA